MEIDRRALATLPWELRAEIDENLCRKDFLPSEIAQVQRACQAILERQARERQGAAGPTSGKGAKPNGSRNLSLTAPGRTSDKIGSLFGLSGRTLEKIAAVCEAAVAEPAKYGKLAADMDRSGRANGPYRRLCNIRQAEAIRAEPPPLPGKGPYRAGFVDFPWAYELLGETALGRGVLPYATMTLDEACAFARSLRSLLAPDAAVGVWVTNFILARGLHLPILEAWDLEPKEVITWPKERAGQGHWARGQSEHFVLAVRGKPTVTLSNHSTLLRGPFHVVQKNAHSAKPIEAYDWFESLVAAARYCDIFSRYRHNERWDCHGFEAPAPALSGELEERRDSPSQMK